MIRQFRQGIHVDPDLVTGVTTIRDGKNDPIGVEVFQAGTTARLFAYSDRDAVALADEIGTAARIAQEARLEADARLHQDAFGHVRSIKPPPNETHHADGSVTIEGKSYTAEEYRTSRRLGFEPKGEVDCD